MTSIWSDSSEQLAPEPQTRVERLREIWEMYPEEDITFEEFCEFEAKQRAVEQAERLALQICGEIHEEETTDYIPF